MRCILASGAGDFDPFLDLIDADADADGSGAAVARFVAERAPAPEPQLPQLRRDDPGGVPQADDAADEDEEDEETDAPVWFDEDAGAWVTYLPPPAGFAGRTWERYGHPDYYRTLDPAEERAQEAREAEAVAELLADEIAERDAWFGFAGGTLGPGAGALPDRVFDLMPA